MGLRKVQDLGRQHNSGKKRALCKVYGTNNSAERSRRIEGLELNQ